MKYTKARRKEFISHGDSPDGVDRPHASKHHTIDWDGVRLPAKEPDWKKRSKCERSHLHQEGGDMHDQLGWGYRHLSEAWKLAAML